MQLSKLIYLKSKVRIVATISGVVLCWDAAHYQKKIIADYSSWVLGCNDVIDAKMVCSLVQTLGIICIYDIAFISTGHADTYALGICSGIILVFYGTILLLKVWKSQQKYTKV